MEPMVIPSKNSPGTPIETTPRTPKTQGTTRSTTPRGIELNFSLSRSTKNVTPERMTPKRDSHRYQKSY